MAKWNRLPARRRAYTYDAAALKKKWARLHAGDAEPLPKDDKVLAAWPLFHAGQFHKATEAGLKVHAAGAGAGMTVANKAQAIYATYLENSEKTKLALLHEVAERAEARHARRSRRTPTPLLHGLCARPLQPGHHDRQGAGAGARREGEDRARDDDQARRRSTPTRTSRSARSTPR